MTGAELRTDVLSADPTEPVVVDTNILLTATGVTGSSAGERAREDDGMNRLSGVTIDCIDPAGIAEFWSALLDRPISDEHDGAGWATIGSRLDATPRLTFQRVPEPRRGKVRLHLDVQVDDIDRARAQIELLGGRWAGERHDYPGEGVVMVMTDPEGNQFCIVQYL